MRNGIDLDVAMNMAEPIRAAFAINFSVFEGHKFNWTTWEFEERDE